MSRLNELASQAIIETDSDNGERFLGDAPSTSFLSALRRHATARARLRDVLRALPRTVQLHSVSPHLITRSATTPIACQSSAVSSVSMSQPNDIGDFECRKSPLIEHQA